jgi:hypothetical protein
MTADSSLPASTGADASNLIAQKRTEHPAAASGLADGLTGIVEGLNQATQLRGHARFTAESDRAYRDTLNIFSRDPKLLDNDGGVLIEHKYSRLSGQTVYQGAEVHRAPRGFEEVYGRVGESQNRYTWIGDKDSLKGVDKVPENVYFLPFNRFIGGRRADGGPGDADPVAASLEGNPAAKSVYNALKSEAGDAQVAGNAIYSLMNNGYKPTDPNDRITLMTSTRGEQLASVGDGALQINARVGNVGAQEIAGKLADANPGLNPGLRTHADVTPTQEAPRIARV